MCIADLLTNLSDDDDDDDERRTQFMSRASNSQKQKPSSCPEIISQRPSKLQVCRAKHGCAPFRKVDGERASW